MRVAKANIDKINAKHKAITDATLEAHDAWKRKLRYDALVITSIEEAKKHWIAGTVANNLSIHALAHVAKLQFNIWAPVPISCSTPLYRPCDVGIGLVNGHCCPPSPSPP